MTNIAETPGWDDVVQLETNVAARGGVGGPMNAQAQALANRSAFIIRKFHNRGPLLVECGGVGDGIADDTRPMQEWLLAAQEHPHAVPGPGIWTFETGLSAPVNQMSMPGVGTRGTEFRYTGTDTTVDMLTIGDGVQSFGGLEISGIKFTSMTRMTAGRALHIRKMQGGSRLLNLDFDDGLANGNLWNAVHLDNVNVSEFVGGRIRAQNECVMMNGVDGDDEGSDVYLSRLILLGARVGTHIGGGIGGIYHDYCLFFGNRTHTLVDNALAARKNRELLFSPLCIFDGCTDYGVHINDPLAGGSNITFNAYLGSAGRFDASAGQAGAPVPIGINMRVENWANSFISVGDGQAFNATSDCFQFNDPTTVARFSEGRQIRNNGGYGINATVPMNVPISGSPHMMNNGAGDWSPNTYRAPVTLTPAGSWKSTATVVKKQGRCTIAGMISKSQNSAIAQYETVATVPVGYRRGDQAVILLVCSGGSSSDVMVPGRINPDGTVQALQPVAGTMNVAFSGSWDMD